MEGGNHTVIKSICFAHSSFQKEKGKPRAFDKEKGQSFSLPSVYEYIPCEQTADFPAVALWGNENAELLFLFHWFWGFLCGDFWWTEWDTRKFGN